MTDISLSERRWKLGLTHWACHRMGIDPALALDAWVASQRSGPDPDPTRGVTVYVSWKEDGERKVSHFNSREGEAVGSIMVFADRLDAPCTACEGTGYEFEWIGSHPNHSSDVICAQCQGTGKERPE